jgi:predicted kinase
MKEQLVVWILVGAPGSGKTTFGQVLTEGDPRIVRVCPDDNRRAISGDSNNQAVSYPAFCMAKDQMRKALSENKCVVFDATNMYRKARKDFINLARGKGAKVIDDMLARYQRPEVPEFDEVVFVSKVS